MDVNNQTILITGGTSGIGLALANKLSKNNCILVLARSTEKMASLFSTNSNIYCYHCNLASQTAVIKALERVIKEHPSITLVINNAGIQHTPLLTADNFQLETINEEIKINLQAPILISALLIRHWQQHNQPSMIVNISSALAIFPKTSAAVYCATKAAIHNFSRALAYQLEHTCTQIQEVILPLVDTPMTKERTGKKISVDTAAIEIIAGMHTNKKIIYVGKTKWIPLLSRIHPTFIAKMLKNY